MRTVGGFFLAFCFVTALNAQIRGVGSVVHPAGGSGTPGVVRTTGSVVNPAGGVPRPVIPGLHGNTYVPTRNRGVSVYPVYIGGYYPLPYISSYDSQAAQPQAPVENTVVVAPAPPVTPVVINYNYGTPPPAQPVADAGTQAPPAEEANAPEPQHYLIAMKDHTIYVASAYWVDGDTLHYFTAGNVHNQTSIGLVDRDFTQRLNKEAGIDVNIPAK